MEFLHQLIALIAVAWLPGAVLFRLPWLERERRAALDPEERAFWAVVLSVCCSLLVVLILAALNRYSLPRLLAVNGFGSLVALGIWRGRLLLKPPRRVSWSAAIPLALVLLCWSRFFPPSEYIMGGKDPGTYVNEGIQIAQRGSLLIRDETVAAVPNFARPLFFPQHLIDTGEARTDYHSIRFMGFFIRDPDRGMVVGQFPHVFPASIAVAYGIAGLTGARAITPLWAILGVLAVYFAAARLFGRTTAAAAAVLLALNVMQVWFARYPNVEVAMQVLLFAMLLANARAHVDGDRFFAPIAGVLIGVLFFLRYDALLGMAALAAGLAFGMFAGQRPRLSLVAVVGFFAVPAVYYYLVPLRPYAQLPIAFSSRIPAWQIAACVLFAVALPASVWLASTRPRVSSAITRYLPLALAALLLGLGLYALYFRHPGGRLTDYDAYALRNYAAFYVTLPAVIAALIGYAVYARRDFWKDPALFTTVVLFSAFLFYKIRIVPEHFWAARRWMPIVLPMTMIFAAAAAIGPGGRGWRSRLRPVLGAVFLGLLANHYARASKPLDGHVEYAGLIPRLEQLASQLGENDLLIVESRNAGGDMHVMGLPLAYIYARPVLVLDSPRPEKAIFAGFLDWARTRYGRVLFLGGGGTDLLSHRYGVRALASERFQVPEYRSAHNAYPRGIRRKEFEYGLYEFVPATPQVPGLWFDLDVGIRDDLHVLRFHAKEESEGRTYRWTQARSMVSVTAIAGTSRTVTLELGDGGRPAAAPPARVEVFLLGEAIGSTLVSGPFAPYSFSIPPALAARAAAVGDPVELRLVTATWQPSTVLGSPDDRNLGVMVDRVTKIRRRCPCRSTTRANGRWCRRPMRCSARWRWRRGRYVAA